MLVMTRKFVREPVNNKISFEYKVDGASCRRGSRSSCSNGLYVYINGKQTLKVDTQFHWTKMEATNLTRVRNSLYFYCFSSWVENVGPFLSLCINGLIHSFFKGLNQIKFVYHKSCTRERVLDVAYIRHIAFVSISRCLNLYF